MFPITLQADLTEATTQLRRIADCLEKLLPPIYPQKGAPAPKEYPILISSNESLYEHEINDQLEWYKDKVEMLMKEYGDKLSG